MRHGNPVAVILLALVSGLGCGLVLVRVEVGNGAHDEPGECHQEKARGQADAPASRIANGAERTSET